MGTATAIAAALEAQVPGEWLLGRGRVFDVLVLPVVFAVLWPLLRAALRTYVYQVRVVCLCLCVCVAGV